jgi:hypothetical protein
VCVCVCVELVELSIKVLVVNRDELALTPTNKATI